jgi:glucose-1-phosphate adenylyltransferase
MVTLSGVERQLEVLQLAEIMPVPEQKRVLAVITDNRCEARMDSLCNGRPMSQLPFAGQYRVIDFSLSNCVNSGIDNIAIILDRRYLELDDYLERWCLTNNPPGSIRILELPAGSDMTTADSVYQNLGFVEESGADEVLLLPAGCVYKMDYRQMLSFHEYFGADLTIAVVPVPASQAFRFGNVTTDVAGRVLDYVDRPGIPRSNLVSIGVYLFNREVLVGRLVEDAARMDNLHDFGRTIIPEMLARRDRVFAYKSGDYWQDISTVEAYHSAHIELTHRLSSLDELAGLWPVLGGRIDLPPPKKSGQGSVKNSIISAGCVIRGQVENSVLSPGVWVDRQSVVRNSVVMTNTIIGSRSIIDHCILGEGVSVGLFCYLGFGPARMPSPDEITVIGRGATIPPHTAIGRSCRILPRVEPSDFVSSAVRAGETVEPRQMAVT